MSLPYYQGTGRRKTSIARVRLVPGTGRWVVNGRTLEGYFPNKVHQQLVNEPFKTLELDDRFDVIARISGGGTTGQCGATLLGLGRAVMNFDSTLEPILREHGFLTRDAREVERKKPGQAGARRRFQFSKR